MANYSLPVNSMANFRIMGKVWKQCLLFTVLLYYGLQYSTAVYAANLDRSYTVHNVPTMYLNVGISATQTADIKLSPPTRNGESQTFPTVSGGILEISGIRYTELISYTGAIVDSSTKEVTLYGVVRGYCWNINSFASCEDGRQWSRGTRVILNNDMRIYNQSLKLDMVNVLTKSGAIRSDDTTQPFLFINPFTTTQRDLISYKGESGDAPIIKNSTTGILQWWDGSSWLDFATSTGSYANATISVRGVVELADTGSIIQMSATGSTGAWNVLTAILTTMTGGLTSDWGKIPILNTSGLLSTWIGGTGLSKPSSGSLLLAQGSGAMKLLPMGSNGQVLTMSGTRLVFKASTQAIGITVGAQTKLGDSTTAAETGTIMTIPAGQFNSANDVIKVTVRGGYSSNANSHVINFVLGTDRIALFSGSQLNTLAAAYPFEVVLYLQATAIGTGGTIVTTGTSMIGGFTAITALWNTDGVSTDSDTVDTTAALTLEMDVTYNASSANNFIQPYSYQVEFIDQ